MKKGFTLIELLAVIIILAIILIIAVPKILDVFKIASEQVNNKQIELFQRAANLYVSNKKNLDPENVEKYITVETLIENGYLKNNIIDPNTKEYLSGVLKVIDDGDYFDLEYIETNNENGEIIQVEPVSSIKNIIVNGNSIQYTSTQGKNLIPTKFEHWESGHYSLSNGQKEPQSNRIRVPYLISTIPSTEYYFSITHPQATFVIRSYDSSGNFLRNKGSIISGIMSSLSDEHYFSVTIYNISASEYVIGFKNKTILPVMYLNSEVDKSFQEFKPKTPSLFYPSEVKSIENSKLIIETCNIFDINTMDITNTTKSNGILSLNPLVYDRILNKTTWVPKPNTDYTLVIDVLENTFNKDVSLITDNRFYFLTNFGTISAGTTGKYVFTSKTREDFSGVTIGSLWFHSDNTITGSLKLKLAIIAGKYNSSEINKCNKTVKKEILLPVLRGFNGLYDTYNLTTGVYTKLFEKNKINNTVDWNDWNATVKRVVAGSNPERKTGFNSLGASNVATVLNNTMGGIDSIGVYSGNSAYYWYPDWFRMGLRESDTMIAANSVLENWLSSNEVYYEYVLKTPIVQSLSPFYYDYIKYIYVDSEVDGILNVEYN